MVAFLLYVSSDVEGKEEYPIAHSPDDTAQLSAHIRHDVEHSARSLSVGALVRGRKTAERVHGAAH